jgi:predicted metal-dependent hydrolase
MEKHTITYKSQNLEFELIRKNVKNINLNTKPDMTITISANEKVPLDYIKSFVKDKAPWIMKNISYFKDVQSEIHIKKDYVSGESFKYLGKQLRLRVQEAEKEEVKYYRGFIYLSVNDKEDYKKKDFLMSKWYRGKATIIFEESLDKMYQLIEKYEIKKPSISIRTMKARWGSCIKDKNIVLLNYELIKAPKYCIDYVVLHELIHFKFRNHDKEFYSFMTALMPDWKKRKDILDEEVVRNL